ncbi:hypothetical protein SR41_05860 [Sphingomonas melonis]|uniref:Uncharacterized protein n=2 Tax=Sphingomonas TaxID=13687 RepID=A0A0D1MEV4_9SPHN|nr:hypothetical protein SR41_05860 [Sphingomonas melonis]
MKHAGPVHHDSAPEARAGKPNRAENGQGLGLPAWLAIGGTLVVGAAAALAVPLLRGRATPVPKRRGKRATVRKAASGAKHRKAAAK